MGILAKFRKAINPDGELEKNEVFDFLFWFRTIFGLLFGIAAGVLKLEGFWIVVSFFVLLFICSYFYTSKVLDVDEEELGQQEVMTEGFANSFGVFMLVWIMTYTYI